MTTTDEPKTCPECNGELEEGKALSLSAMAVGAAYLCTTCRVIYTRDLRPLARFI